VLGSGGGITADSAADAEWDECLHKAASILGAGAGSAAKSQHRVVELTP
jgi:para-aminobenzoate synthetase component 1